MKIIDHESEDEAPETEIVFDSKNDIDYFKLKMQKAETQKELLEGAVLIHREQNGVSYVDIDSMTATEVLENFRRNMPDQTEQKIRFLDVSPEDCGALRTRVVDATDTNGEPLDPNKVCFPYIPLQVHRIVDPHTLNVIDQTRDIGMRTVVSTDVNQDPILVVTENNDPGVVSDNLTVTDATSVIMCQTNEPDDSWATVVFPSITVTETDLSIEPIPPIFRSEEMLQDAKEKMIRLFESEAVFSSQILTGNEPFHCAQEWQTPKLFDESIFAKLNMQNDVMVSASGDSMSDEDCNGYNGAASKKTRHYTLVSRTVLLDVRQYTSSMAKEVIERTKADLAETVEYEDEYTVRITTFINTVIGVNIPTSITETVLSQFTVSD